MPDYKAAWRVRTRSWATEFLGGYCVKCGVTEDLEFDHIDSVTKSFEISVGIANCYSRARLQVELLKCQLLCKSCHHQKSIDYGDIRTVEHGGGKSGKHDCKCDPCHLKKNEYLRNLKRRKRALIAHR